jgi:hypothetical protein
MIGNKCRVGDNALGALGVDYAIEVNVALGGQMVGGAIMEWSGVFRIVTAGLASVGGAGVIIIAVANWLAKLWANRILEHDKKRYSEQMEELLQKHRCELKELQEQLNIYRECVVRYQSAQFTHYCGLWASLYDLKVKGDDLWESATAAKVSKFQQQFMKTKHEIEKGSLLIEDEHYSGLRNILQRFEEYELGKRKLLAARQNDINSDDIDRFIDNNNIHRKQYNDLIMEIRSSFRRQIKGECHEGSL